MILPTLTFVYDRRGRASRTKPASVELSVYADGKRKYISTGVKLLPKEWSKGEVNSCRPDYAELNELLFTFKRKVTEIVTRMIKDGSLDLNALPSILEQEIALSDTFINYAKSIAERRYRTIAEGTRKHYKVFFDFLESWGVITYFSDITEKNIIKMDDALKKRKLKQCTRWNYHKLMKSFVLQAIEDGVVKKNPYSRVEIKRGNENGLKRMLTPQEFHRLEEVEIDQECIRRVRDLFVFQTYTLMAYSDLAEFSWKNCKEQDGQVVYKAKRKKTGQEFVVVLLPKALEILKRYRNKLPIISNVKYNLYLKAAVLYAKINKPVTTHWARHTGATMLVNEWKVDIHIVQHILGHASIRETERTYAKVLDKTIVDAMSGLGQV